MMERAVRVGDGASARTTARTALAVRPPPVPGGRLAELQRAIGNRAVVAALGGVLTPSGTAVQRNPMILAYDRNTDKNSQDDATLDLGQLRTALQAGVSNLGDRAAVLLNLSNNQDVQTQDVSGLAAILAAGLPSGTRQQVEEAIGGLLQGEHLAKWTQVEADQNDALLRAPDATLSRAKGVTNTIPLATLDDITKADFTVLIAAVRNLDTKTRRPLNFADASGLDEAFLLQHLSGAMDVRSCHTNGAGWLPDASASARFLALTQQIDDANQFQANKRNKPLSDFRFTGINKLKPDERRDFLWSAHCEQFNGSPYVELSVPGKKDLRLVYQCLTGDFYATVHYKWQRGYNPFFRVVL